MSEITEDRQRWLKAQLDAAEELAKIGSQALQQRRTDLGAEALEEAEVILDMAEEETDRLLELRARVFNELGVVHQRQQRLEESRDYHSRAAEICDDLMEKEVDFASNSAATHLNLSSIELALGNADRARECGEKALELLRQARESRDGEETGPDPLELGAHQNLAVIYAQQQAWEEAKETMEEAGAMAEELETAGRPSFAAQFAQGCQQLSVILFENDRYEEALDWGRKAEEMSEKAYEALGQRVLPIYVISQINLISYNEKLGRYADGEDCLWKALDVAGEDPRILHRGVSFYETCRKQADSRLEKGNLPREEVEEGYEEILQRVEAAGGLDAVRERARQMRRG